MTVSKVRRRFSLSYEAGFLQTVSSIGSAGRGGLGLVEVMAGECGGELPVVVVVYRSGKLEVVVELSPGARTSFPLPIATELWNSSGVEYNSALIKLTRPDRQLPDTPLNSKMELPSMDPPPLLVNFHS